MTSNIKDIVIVGRDAPVWLTALAVQRAVARLPIRLSVVELPAHDQPTDVLTVLPTHLGLHDLLGIKEEEVLKDAGASYSFGHRYSGWSRSAPDFLVPFDAHGISLYTVPFVQYWLKARAQGLNVPLEDFSLGGVAAKQARFAELSDATVGFSRVSYGYSLDAVRYAEFLREKAISVGVRTIASDINRVVVEDGRIVRVEMPSGHDAEGQFFIDVTGPEARLIREIEPQNNLEDWSDVLRTNRVLSAAAEPLSPLPGFVDIRTFEAGWCGLYPLQDRLGVVLAYDKTVMPDEAVADALPRIAGRPVAPDAVVSDVKAGARRAPWVSNCVAIGGGSVALDPLDALPMSVVHHGISHLMPLLPRHAEVMPEARPYNNAMELYRQNARDYALAHFALNGRTGDVFWDRARAVSLPQSLQYKIDLFAGRGGMALYDAETFLAPEWSASFIGHGLIPRSYDPRVDGVPDQEQIRAFQELLRTIAIEVENMPTIQAQVDLHTAPTHAIF